MPIEKEIGGQDRDLRAILVQGNYAPGACSAALTLDEIITRGNIALTAPGRGKK